MRLQRATGTWVIIGSFFLAIMLNIWPFPFDLGWFAPRWIPLVLIYWVVALPHRVGIFSGWLLGIFMDLIDGSLLGQNALALSVVAYILLVMYQRMRMYDVWQQACVVFVLVGVDQLLCYWVMSITGVAFNDMSFLISALVSALVWPWIWLFLQQVTEVFDVT